MACDIDILSGYLTMTSSPFIGFTLLSATVMQLLVPRKQRLPRPGRPGKILLFIPYTLVTDVLREKE